MSVVSFQNIGLYLRLIPYYVLTMCPVYSITIITGWYPSSNFSRKGRRKEKRTKSLPQWEKEVENDLISPAMGVERRKGLNLSHKVPIHFVHTGSTRRRKEGWGAIFTIFSI
jgi:hypothetical protein